MACMWHSNLLYDSLLISGPNGVLDCVCDVPRGR